MIGLDYMTCHITQIGRIGSSLRLSRNKETLFPFIKNNHLVEDSPQCKAYRFSEASKQCIIVVILLEDGNQDRDEQPIYYTISS